MKEPMKEKMLTLRVPVELWRHFRDTVREEDGQTVSAALREYMEARVA